MSKVNNAAYTVTILSVNASPNIPPVNIEAPMPESFMYDAQVMYEAPFTQSLTGNSAIDTILKVGFAAKLVTHAMTAQFWQGSTDTELGLELEFHADSDPATEVRDPIISLLRLTTPTTQAGLISSPGPQLTSQVILDILTAGKNAGASIPEGTQGEVSAGQTTDTEQSVTQGDQGRAKTSNLNAENATGTVAYWKTRIENQISIRIGKYAFFDSVVVTSVRKTYESQFDAVTGLPFYAKVAIQFKPLFMIVQDDLNKIFGVSSNSPVAQNSGAQNVGTTTISRPSMPTREGATSIPTTPPRQASATSSTGMTPGQQWGQGQPGSIKDRIDAGGYPKKVD